MKKKLLSVVLAGSVVASVAAIGAVSASAIVAEDGTYKAGDGITTKRVYFTLPESWKNDYTESAGIYWWGGTDTAGDNAQYFPNKHEWPAYKMVKDDSNPDITTLWYADIPEDVPTVVFNNYLDGGMDDTQPQYTKAIQCRNSPCECYADGDITIYDKFDGFWSDMVDSYEGDKAALGDYADNFFYVEDDVLAFTMDNMIWVPDLSQVTENEVSHRLSYGGDWYFYYGDGTYGNYPTKADAEAKGFVKDIALAEDPTDPATPDEPTTTATDPSATTATDSTSATTVTGQPSTDATSSVGGTSTSDSASKTTTTSNGSVSTGTASLAVILFVVISAAGSVVYFTRRKKND